MNDKLQDINQTLSEDSINYYTDAYNLWLTKEQITIWNEVKEIKTEIVEIDTSDTSIEKVWQSFILTVPNPDGKIFSMWIDWMEKTFKIGFFGNTTTAYNTLVSEMQTWLWIDYTVTYLSWTSISISKYDGSVITKTTPNLVRNINLSSFDSISVINVIVDGVTVVLDWPTHSWNANTAITYLMWQLSSSLYYMDDDLSNLIIARKDWAIPVISKTQYNKYTYHVIWYSSIINPTSTNLWWSAWSTEVKEYKIYANIDWNTSNYTLSSWLTFTPTSATITFPNITALSPSQTDNNDNHHWTKALDMLYWLVPWTWYTKWSITTYSVSWTDFFGYQFPYNKNDYSQSVSTASIDYIIDTSLALVNVTSLIWFSSAETNHKADITTTTYTEITITNALSSNGYYIPVWFNPSKIEITAESTAWRSTWTWEWWAKRWIQSCNSSVSWFVSDKVFQTSGANYGNITKITRAWFYINWTTAIANKLYIKCTQ